MMNRLSTLILLILVPTTSFANKMNVEKVSCATQLEEIARNTSLDHGMEKELAIGTAHETEVSETINGHTKYSIYIGARAAFHYFEIVSGKNCGIINFKFVDQQ